MAQLPQECFRSYSITDENYQYTSTTDSGKKHIRKIPGHIFKISLSTGPLTVRDAKAVMGFVRGKGEHIPYEIVIPDLSYTSGNLAPGQLTASSAAIGSDSVNVSGGGTVSSGLVAGDFIKFGNQWKVYQVTADVTFSAGSGTIEIYPPLLNSVGSGEAVLYDDVPFHVVNVGGLKEFSRSATNGGWMPSFELDVEEYL